MTKPADRRRLHDHLDRVMGSNADKDRWKMIAAQAYRDAVADDVAGGPCYIGIVRDEGRRRYEMRLSTMAIRTDMVGTLENFAAQPGATMLLLERVEDPGIPCVKCRKPVEVAFRINLERAEYRDRIWCLACSHKDLAERRGNDADAERVAAVYNRKRAMTGIPASYLESLGITDKSLLSKTTKKPRFVVAALAIKRYLSPEAATQRLLILAGPSGTGKSTFAAQAAWETGGLFLERVEWSKWGDFKFDRDLYAQYARHPGVVVIDDAFAIGKDGRGADDARVTAKLFELVQTRHENNRPVVITTNATVKEMAGFGSLGDALLRRARDGHDAAGAPLSGGYVWCAPVETKEAER